MSKALSADSDQDDAVKRSALRVAIAQDAPVFLDRAATVERVIHYLREAGNQQAQLVAFGETFVPGYPFWIEHTDGARFEDSAQKEAYRQYLAAAVCVDGPEVAAIESCVKEVGLFAVLGVAERGPGPGAGSVYCTALCIDPERGLVGHHRKLVPTFEERLIWAPGDGYGLRAHAFGSTRISALNCWENWMPLPRYCLWGQGTEVHVALWPGAVANTSEVTRMLAREGRAFVVSASGVLAASDIPSSFALADQLPMERVWRNGGSAIAGPDGRFVVEPVADRRGLIVAELPLAEVARERYNFDPTGHYARPDVFELRVNRRRLEAVHFDPSEPESS